MQNSVSVENNSSEARNNPGGQNTDKINSSQLLSENNVAIISSSISSTALNTSSNVSSESSTEQNPLSPQTNQNNTTPTSEISESVSSNQQASNNGGIEKLGINIDKPKYPNYATLQTRISSYQGWPAYLDQTPRDMAMAGFLFAGYNDYTRCFFCGGGLRNWEAGDDPWVEHARWFPQCAFLKQNKGERFIQAVLKRHQEMEQQTMRTNGQSSGHPSSPPPLPAATNQKLSSSHNVTDNDPLSSIAARSVLEMGFSKEQVRRSLRKIGSSPPGSKEILATDILKIILKKKNGKELSWYGAAGNAMKCRQPKSPPAYPTATNQKPNPSHKVTDNDLLSSTAATSLLDRGYSRKKVLRTLREMSSRPGFKEISTTHIMRVIQKEEDDKELSCQGAVGNVMKQTSSENVAVSEVIPELFTDEEIQAVMEENWQL